MKKILSLLSLAVLTVGLLGSCSKINERLDNLEKDVNGLKNEKIASIESQIAGITSSIADLGTIRSDISSLKQSAEHHGIDIFNLEEADRALADRILNLEDYLDDVLPNYAEKEWVEATFSTLEQYEETCDAIAEINVKIGELDARTARDIQACADSMKTWVNEQLDAYYTAAGMDAKLAKMKSAVDSARAANKITDAKADSIARELAKTKTAVDTAKANIRKEYKAAIKSAIDSSEARLTKKIQNKINKANKGVEELAGRVSDLEAEVDELTGRVEALEGMIQSVVIVPAYSDGSVKVENDSLYIDCIVSPSSVVEELDTAGVSILINKVKTKAYSGVDTIKISEGDLFEKDDTKGTVSVRVSVAGKIPAADSTITVAVNVKKDKSDYTTEFVPVTLPISVSLDKHSIVVPFSTTSRDTILTATVENSTKGVTWTSINTNIATVDANGKVTIKANISGKDTIVVTTVECAKKDTCVITVQGPLPGGFSVSATKKVHFSQGNLQATYNSSTSTYTWCFAATQYGYIGNATGNTTIDSQTNGAVVDLFGWSTSSTTYGISISPYDIDYSGEFVDWGKAIDDKGTWRTLSKDEWIYLINSTGVENIRKGKYKTGVTVCGNAYCLILAPDDFEGTIAASYDATAWATAEAAGLVCLPAAGSRDYIDGGGYYVTVIHSAGESGLYWSSTAKDENKAYDVLLSDGSVDGDYRVNGISVRLITEVK